MAKLTIKIEYKTKTENQKQITRITWTVPDFIDLLNDGTTKELRTDESQYSTDKDEDPRFLLKMQFKGMFNDLIEIYFLSPKPVFLEYELKLMKYLQYQGNYYNDYQERKDFHIVHAQKWQYVRMLRKDIIDSYLAGNSLKLHFEIKEPCNIKVKLNVDDVKLSKDYESLLDSSIFSDVTMKSAEAIEYKVHKVVLACRSKVLKAHFEHNTTECLSNVVESPLESEVLQEVITFIYTDKTSRVDEIPEKLLAAAEYYQLIKLKGLCEVALHQKLTVDNAIETLQLADYHSATDLKQWTLEFIKDNQGKVIIKSGGWAKLESVRLIKMICEYIIDNHEPSQIPKFTVEN